MALVLITANSRRVSTFDDFTFPEEGKSFSSYRNLYGLLNGEGDASILDYFAMKWIVIDASIENKDVADGIVSFRVGKIVHIGDEVSATKFILERNKWLKIIQRKKYSTFQI